MIYLPQKTYDLWWSLLHPRREKLTLQEQIERIWRRSTEST